MNIWVMAIICGIFSTLLVNPYFIIRIFRGTVEYNKKKEDTDGEDRKKEESFWKECCGFEFSARVFWIVQCVIFAVVVLITAPAMYWFSCLRTLLGITCFFWLVAIMHCINGIIMWGFSLYYEEKAAIRNWSLVTVSILILIWLVPSVLGDIYNVLNPIDSHTYLEEEKVPVISVDVIESLEKQCILEGYTLEDPIARQGNVVYPMSKDGNVAIAGYVMVKDEQPIFVRKELPFNPYQLNANCVGIIFREQYPTKMIFGRWSFQIDPEGEVWFVGMYGHYTFLKGGREIEGLVSINGSTGEVVSYKLEEIPDWVTGISE